MDRYILSWSTTYVQLVIKIWYNYSKIFFWTFNLKYVFQNLSICVQGGLVFVCGSRDGLMTVTGRKHNADDIIATVLAVEPMKFIYRGRIAVFSIRVLRDERICVIAEQRPDCSEEEVTCLYLVQIITNYGNSNLMFVFVKFFFINKFAIY